MSENAQTLNKLVRLIHERFSVRNNIRAERRATSLNLDVELVDRFLQAARTLGFPVSSRRNANKVIEAFMELVIEQANICQQQVTLLTVNYKPKIISLTVEQRIKVNMVKADLLKTLKKLEQHKGDAYADHWKNRLAKSLKKAVKVVEGTRDPELLQLLEQAEKAWGGSD